MPRYKVFRHGKLQGEVLDIDDLWKDDFIVFLLGCSFSLEEGLMEKGLQIRHIDEGKNVPMFKTKIACEGVGVF